MNIAALLKHPRLAVLWPYLSLLLWVGPLLLLRSSQQSLMAHDEGIYATQARSILELNDWVAPQWGGDYGFDRTIGIQWVMALCYRLFGVSEDSARLPSAIAFSLTVLLTYAIGSRLLDRRLAWLGAAILAVTPISLQYGRLATQDAVLVFVELLGIWALLKAADFGKGRPGWSILAGATLGLGFMIKGFMIIPVAVALLPYLLWNHRHHRHLTNPWLYLGLVLGSVPVVAWLGASAARFGAIPFEQLFGKLFHLKQQTFQGAGPLYYFWNIPANAFPWIFFALLGLGLLGQQIRQGKYPGPSHTLLLLVGYPLFLFVELTLFGTRTRYYPLQLLPLTALWAAVGMDWLMGLYIRRERSRLLGILSYTIGGLGLLLIILQLLVSLDWLPLNLRGTEAEEIQRYGMVAFGLGLGWLMVLGVWRSRATAQDLTRSAQCWLAGWLMGPWLAIALLGLTGQWGNYNSDLKTFLQRPDIAVILREQTVHFVAQEAQLDRQGRKTYLLIYFYTPHWGKEWATLPDLPAPGYAWAAPNLISPPGANLKVQGTIRGWNLVQTMK